MECISLTNVAVCWNGTVLEPFSPWRCLRQGDPLSPYLFVLCMEVLIQMIVKAVDDKWWSPIRVSRSGPQLSHLFFADDLLLFEKTSISQARVMEHLLAQFCGFSGQRVNRNKSRIWFSPNTPTYLHHSICSEFKILATTDLGKYLVISLLHKYQSKEFWFILHRVKR